MKQVRIFPIREDDVGMSVFIQEHEEVEIIQEFSSNGDIVFQAVTVPERAIVIPDVCTH
jgi:hypothetical protein